MIRAGSQTDIKTIRSPWTFVPTLYFAEGLPYVIINTVSVALYKRMDVDNARIAFWTSWLYLPWVIKMFWSPMVDLVSTKRNWIISTQVAMALCLFIVSSSLMGGSFFVVSLAAFCAAAFVSATHDIATDGFYMLALTKSEQALFVGIRTTFYRLAMIFGSGALVYLAGILEESGRRVADAWMISTAVPTVMFILFALYHRAILPFPREDGRGVGGAEEGSFIEIISSYFRQEKIWAVIAFILLYRFAEAMMLKLVAPFLLDSEEVGGLGLSTKQLGLVYGTVGMICLIMGGIIGGWLIAKYGFRRCIWPMALALHLPDAVYVYMAYTRPPIEILFPLVALEQLGYGVGFTAFTVFLMYASRGRYKTSHFAISTGIMALGMMIPGAISGYIQQALGYKTFFLIVMAMTLPGMLSVVFIPKDDKVSEISR